MNGMLIIRNGAPFYEGASVPIPKDKACIIGRSSEEWEPYLAFQSAYISRKHFEVTYESNAFFITDLFSKHGTKVNGEELQPGTPRLLKERDVITLANEEAALVFRNDDMDATLDLGPLLKQINKPFYTLDPILQKVKVKEETYILSDKEYACLAYLLEYNNQFVSKEALKKSVWPERVESNGEILVAAEELNALIYRVRKKIGTYLEIEVIRGKGYWLHFNENGRE